MGQKSQHSLFVGGEFIPGFQSLPAKNFLHFGEVVYPRFAFLKITNATIMVNDFEVAIIQLKSRQLMR